MTLFSSSPWSHLRNERRPLDLGRQRGGGGAGRWKVESIFTVQPNGLLLVLNRLNFYLSTGRLLLETQNCNIFNRFTGVGKFGLGISPSIPTRKLWTFRRFPTRNDRFDDAMRTLKTGTEFVVKSAWKRLFHYFYFNTLTFFQLELKNQFDF